MATERMICERKAIMVCSMSIDEDTETLVTSTPQPAWTMWEPVEPAPPKEWKPNCYTPDIGEDCFWKNLIRCEGCPWMYGKKKEEK